MSENKLYAWVWFLVITASLGIALTVGSCVQQNNVLENRERLACIQSHGNWDYVRGSNATFGCTFNK